MPSIFLPISNLLRRRKRDALLAQAASWTPAPAILLKSTVVPKDALAEGTTFQEQQVEAAFSFTLDGTYFGGYARSVAMSDSEAHRALRLIPEDTPITIRYNPANPDQAIALPTDNPTFPFPLWPV